MRTRGLFVSVWLFAGWLVCQGGVPQPPGWQVLFRYDFEQPWANDWQAGWSEPGAEWRSEKEGGNTVLSVEGNAWLTLRRGVWSDFRLQARVKLIEGSIHLNYRLTGCRRYFVRLEPGPLSLNRTAPCDIHTPLATANAGLALARWYTVAIVGIGSNIKVYLDGALSLNFTDPDPVLAGGVALESMGGSHVHVDDLEVSGPPPLDTLTWVRTGGPLGGVGYDIRMRPDSPDIMYVTETSSGVSISSDGGRTWKPSNQGILSVTGPSGDGIPVFCLTIDPHNPDVIWTGTQNMRGIYKSVDGGKTWALKDRGVVERSGISFRGFTVDPRNSSVVYAAAEISSFVWAGKPLLGKAFDLTQGVVYKTADGGENWTAIWRGDNLARYIWIDPRNTNVLYVSTGFWDREAANTDAARDIPGGVGILKSTDGGRTWRALNQANGLKNLYLGSLFMHPQNPDILLAGAGHNHFKDGQGIYLTTNGGETWENVLPVKYRQPDASSQITAVEFSATDPRLAYAMSQHSFYRSTDGGRTWDMVVGLPDKGTWGPPDVFPGQPSDLQVDPRNPNRVFVNNYSGGNFLTEDGGFTWTAASRGYTGANLLDIAVDPSDQQRVYAVGRPGAFRSDDGGNTWQGLNYGLGREPEWYSVAVNPASPERTLFGHGIYSAMYFSRDYGREWKIAFTHPQLQRDTLGPRHGFKAIAFAPSNTAVVYAGMARGWGYFDAGIPDPSFGVFKSMDGGETWREANDPGVANRSISALAVDPRSESIVYAGTATGGVFRTLDGGRSWQPLNNGLRGVDVRAIAIDPKNYTLVYAGLENGGVYKSTDAGTTWRATSAGMDPAAAVRDIVIDPTNPLVVYAADLRTGVYRSEDGGALWVQINKSLRTRAVKALALSSDGGTLYAATEGEGVFRLDIKSRAEAAVSAVSAASFAKDAPLAPESIASLFGAGLAAITQRASATPLPTVLSDASVSLTDSEGVDRWAPLFFVSPGQINCQIPAGTTTGPATVRVFRQNRVVARGQVRIEPVAPALFTANSDGKGAPAAVALRISADGSQTQLPVFQCGASCTPAPIDLGAESDQVILLLFGTGIRGGRSVSVRIGGVEAPVLGTAAQGQYVGLDQVNLRLPHALAGRGEVELVVTVDGEAANAVRVSLR